MEELLKDFEVPPKNSSEAALRRWRKLVTIVRNPRRRFRMIANLEKRSEAEQQKLKIKEKIRVALIVQKAALQFIDAAGPPDYKITDEVRQANFGIEPDELASIVHGHDIKRLKSHGGVDGIAEKVTVSLDEGVCSENVSTRQRIYGFNRYTEKPPRNFWMFVWDALQDLTLIILMICAVISIGVGLATEGWPKGMYDGAGILLSIILVVLVTAISDYRQSLQFRDLDREKKKISVQVTRDGRRQQVSIYDLVVGDVVHLGIGDQVPADGLYISGYGVQIDESSLSGETDPVDIYEQKPFLLSGTKVRDGSAKMLVTAVGMRTEWGKLMETLNEGGEDETPLQVKLNGVATIIGKIGLTFAVLTFLVLTVRFLIEKALHNEFTKWSSTDALTLLDYFAIAVTIITGTLTTNHMVVNKMWICEKISNIGGNENKNIDELEIHESVFSILLRSIFLNSSAEVVKDENGKNSILGTPTETALLEFGLLLSADLDAYRRQFKILKVEPFNSDRKKMSVLVALPEGRIQAFCKGAPEIVLRMCEKVVDSSGEVVLLSEERVRDITEDINGFASDALRTLCVAVKDVGETFNENGIPDSGYTLIAAFGIKDPVRPGVKEAVQTCLAAGITVRMVTGDNINTAKAIAKECGILTAEENAIEGPEFSSKSPDEMKDIIPNIQVMARSKPSDKLNFVTNLRNMFGEVVAVTGDGTNDAPALRQSDIGLAMGIAGTEVAKENADVIVMDDNFATIVNVAKWGRAVYINIQKFVQFQLTVNVVALIINFVSACISGSAPLTAVQLLWVNMIMDTLGALALATEPPNDALMKRPPVPRGASFITKPMWRNIIGQSIYQLIVLGVLNFDGKQLLRLTGSDATTVLNTVIFNSFVFCQVFNEINSREIEKINIFRGMFSSWIFLGVMASTVAFQVVIVEFLGTFASTVPLSWQLWLLCILIGSVSLIVGVIVKCIPVERAAVKPKHHDGYDALPSGPELA
ncbi:Autoinhibited Ca2+-ATPase 11 isoform 1 [Gossypium australe]|uniref:Calcium-transporting ATPase n=1 Tax=Gossypium australe TaxID=47621 RepID=A0A5B6TYT0_9ROSI|nr:Autoinhibited Ca2+-ATPase 11 isoform 1 [Gossypium australe]